MHKQYRINPRSVHYDETVDEFSAGVILYILLAGYPPWWSEGDKFVGKIHYDPSVWNQYEDSAKNLVAQLANSHREKRWDAEQALNSEWYASKLGSDHLTGTHENLKTFNARRKF